MHLRTPRTRPTSPSRAICYVTTILPSFTAFFARTAAHLAAQLHVGVCVISSEGASAMSAARPVRFEIVAMRRGIDPHAALATIKMYQVFRRERFSIVEYTTPKAALYASIAAFFARIPIRIYKQGGLRYLGFTGTRRWFFKQLERLTCRLSTHVEPVSKSNLEQGERDGLYSKAKSSVIWNGSACGVDLERFDPARAPQWRKEFRDGLGVAQSSVVIGFVGRLSRDKGANELLVACREIMAARADVVLVIVGRLNETDGIASDLAEWMRQEPRVVLCGFREDIPVCMAGMDILALPTYREGFGQVLIEAQAIGVATVSTAVPGPVDAVVHEHTGILVRPGDARALTYALRRLVDDPALRMRFASEGVEHARRSFDQTQFLEHVAATRRRQLVEAGLAW